MTTDRFLGDGAPGPEGDTRVRCWFCAHYTHNLQVAIWKHDEAGKYREHWHDVRTCKKGLGHDPFILRRCEAFKVISPQYRIKLPDEAFQRGWRGWYGDDHHYKGTRNTVTPDPAPKTAADSRDRPALREPRNARGGAPNALKQNSPL